MNEPDVFVLADRALNNVVAQIGAAQWDMPMPASFVRRGSDHTPTLREIIGYHAYEARLDALFAAKNKETP